MERPANPEETLKRNEMPARSNADQHLDLMLLQPAFDCSVSLECRSSDCLTGWCNGRILCTDDWPGRHQWFDKVSWDRIKHKLSFGFDTDFPLQTLPECQASLPGFKCLSHALNRWMVLFLDVRQQAKATLRVPRQK